MEAKQILDYCLSSLNGTVLVESWGEKGIFYNPGLVLKRGVYILTVKEKDGDNDKASNLDRTGIYRVNLGLRKSTFQKMYGKIPARPAAGGVVDMDCDFTALDIIIPHPIYAWMGWVFDGELRPIADTDKIRLTDLKNYEAQRQQVIDNTICFLRGKPAQNVLLYGERGTGKSSTVKAILNEYEELRMVEVSKNDVAMLPALFRKLRNIPLRFIVTIDDLAFVENDDRFGILKAALEGSLSAKPDNILIYATTNRRKIVRETAADREISGADAIDESMSLADRFGLFITFMKPDKQVFLDIVQKLAADKGLVVSAERLETVAERFALRHGGRSPRTARQFVDWLDGRISLDLEY